MAEVSMTNTLEMVPSIAENIQDRTMNEINMIYKISMMYEISTMLMDVVATRVVMVANQSYIVIITANPISNEAVTDDTVLASHMISLGHRYYHHLVASVTLCSPHLHTSHPHIVTALPPPHSSHLLQYIHIGDSQTYPRL